MVQIFIIINGEFFGRPDLVNRSAHGVGNRLSNAWVFTEALDNRVDGGNCHLQFVGNRRLGNIQKFHKDENFFRSHKFLPPDKRLIFKAVISMI